MMENVNINCAGTSVRKILLTSAGFENKEIGVENKTIGNAFLSLVGKEPKNINVIFIPTAAFTPTLDVVAITVLPT